MAFIPLFYTISQSLSIDNASTTPIIQGSVLKLSGFNSDNNPLVALASNTDTPVGIAADNFMFNSTESTSGHTVGANSNDLAYAADIVVGAAGQTTRSMNRINDLYKDTLASGLMTVYSGSVVGRTTRFVPGSTFTPGTAAYLSTASNAEEAGKITGTQGGSATKVGLVLQGNVASASATAGGYAFPSGVPGTDVAGSISLGNFVTIQCNF